MAAAAEIRDAYMQSTIRFLVGWDEFHRGRMAKAYQAAEDVILVGRQVNDPRSVGYGMSIRAWIALTSDDYLGALNFAETGLTTVLTPFDRATANNAKIISLVLLERPNALELLQSWIKECVTNQWRYHLTAPEGILGIAWAIRGNLSRGIRQTESTILRREQKGCRTAADWLRLFLCEIYLEIISGKKKPPARVVLRNILTIIVVTFTARKRITRLIAQARKSPHFDPNGHHIGRCEMILGLQAKKKRGLAVQHLTEARRITSQFGPSPMLVKIEAALAELA